MSSQPIILESATKRGIDEADLLHAYNNYIRYFVQSDEMTMLIGPARDGILIEVGVVVWHGDTAIAHGWRPARDKYLR